MGGVMNNYIYLLLFYLVWVFVWGWLFYKLETLEE